MSGRRPPLRSSKFGDGTTSATMKESGEKAVMSRRKQSWAEAWAGCDRGVDNGRASFTAPSKKQGSHRGLHQGLQKATAVRLPGPRLHSCKCYWRLAGAR